MIVGGITQNSEQIDDLREDVDLLLQHVNQLHMGEAVDGEAQTTDKPQENPRDYH